MQLQLIEDDIYYYDAIAAEKPIKFAEKYLYLYEDRYAGKPLVLADWQKEATRNIFGWKRRSDGLRRFKEVFLLTSKGSGKSPLVTMWALYEFLATAQQGQHILSIGTNFPVANITFECAKKLIEASPLLSKMVIETEGDSGSIDIKQYEILNHANNSKWTLMSGDAKGKHGFRTNIVLGDEVWEWDNKSLYYNVKSNLFKRSEPLLLLATNAGMDRNGICWDLYERAKKTLEGDSEDDTFYPIIYEASPKDDWTDEQTWIKANPSLGHTFQLDDLRLKYRAAKENRGLEVQFKRENLSIWQQPINKWLDLNQWDLCVRPCPFSDEQLKTLPSYISFDLSKNDDLTCVTLIVVGENQYYVKSWTYVPKLSALKYEQSESVPFTEWAEKGYVRLLDSDTVDDAATKRIERFIVKLAEKYNVQTIAYDSWNASSMVARLEKRGLTMVPVQQKPYLMAPPTAELARMIKAQEIYLPNNPCLRWQASNVEVESDKHGNITPVKEGRKGSYAGRRGCKIDAIVSIIIALSEVRQRNIAKESPQDLLKRWDTAKMFI